MVTAPVPRLLAGRCAALACIALLLAPAAWAQNTLPGPLDVQATSGVPVAPPIPTPMASADAAADARADAPTDASAGLATGPGPLVTKSGLRLGVSTGYTHYRESLMQLAGPNLGVQLEWAQPWGLERWVLQAQGLLSAPHYSSPVSGAIDRRTTLDTAWRALYSLSAPGTASAGRWDAGLEWQTYYNDLRGTTSVGHVGYERERYGLWALAGYQSTAAPAQSQGAQHWRLEAAVLLQGLAVSHLSQVSASYGDAVNRQSRGISLRAERSYRYAPGEFRPYLSVSWVDDSDVQRQINASVTEPANTTWQLGLKWFWK
jgi:hypothetical protein